MKGFDNIIGKKFGKWTIIGDAPNRIDSSGKYHRRYLCQCECGNILEKDYSKLKLGAKMCKSCYLKIAHKNSKPFEKKNNDYCIIEDYAVVFASNTGNPFIFDCDDYDKVKQICWYESENGYLHGYNTKTKKRVALHRFVMNAPANINVDHKNRVTNDCRKENLRICSQADNTKNKSLYRNNKSGKNGVFFDKRNGKWVARIQHNKRTKYLGSFHRNEDAIAKRIEAEIEYYGEFAPL